MIDDLLNEKCVVWPVTGRDKFGQPTYGAAVERDCHWENKAVLFRNAKGEEVVSRAVVYLEVAVGRGSMMWWGELTDVPDSADPKSDSNTDVFEVQQEGRISDVDNEETLYEAFLQ